MNKARDIPHVDAWRPLDDLNTRDLQQREHMAYCLVHVWQQADRVCEQLPPSGRNEIEAAALTATIKDQRSSILNRDYLAIRQLMHDITDGVSEYLVDNPPLDRDR